MSVTEISMTDKIDALKAAVKNVPQVVMPTRHFLVEGMYARQILIPAHTAFVGRKHKKPHYFMCLAGGAMVTADDGSIHNVRAGMVLMSALGTQRIGVTYADTVFVGIFRTDETDLAKIEDDLVEFDPTARYGVGNEILEIPPKEPKCLD